MTNERNDYHPLNKRLRTPIFLTMEKKKVSKTVYLFVCKTGTSWKIRKIRLQFMGDILILMWSNRKIKINNV
ncbi:hypothetical protein B1F79_01440 [Coxiella-like endosymbiont of Rhipicephalus sanguineus]|nr:hypothetical protein [Coxiella-like endosymbiont of Rhipicephalus sanguineus]